MSLRLVVLVSGSGTLLQALMDGCAAGQVDAEVVAVGADRPEAHGLERARQAGVPAFSVPMAPGARRGTPERVAWDIALAAAVAAHSPDLVVSAGFMKLLGPEFLERFPQRIINTHPALLPSFPGAHAVRDALAAGATSTGATVFWVDEGVDTGSIIAQTKVPVLPGDDEDTLHERIKIVERQLLCETVNRLADKENHS